MNCRECGNGQARTCADCTRTNETELRAEVERLRKAYADVEDLISEQRQQLDDYSARERNAAFYTGFREALAGEPCSQPYALAGCNYTHQYGHDMGTSDREAGERLRAEVERLRQYIDGNALQQGLPWKNDLFLSAFDNMDKLAKAEARIDAALEQAEWLFNGGYFTEAHESDCPEDDTCQCEWTHRLNLLFAELQGRENVAKRIRAAIKEEKDDE
jgi:hypothetical protein